ncbi:[acyl-carrier-protein] S-malonyltransferase [Tilletia horrida]|uniref:[acyl-carrier-protein] S-malonyltransferase n=1 Tax=Tilletia horrida TaxID=155126 RepID=A0AAN6JRS2_9BASI|nr:[acyl-carrier-protein] S-malonyltransferase [Tilletia horrida]KAK0551150.1 [acyl-carrier-protein] S-malonyltransferase [Tilletia horrida]KAK0566117.1 [acyl-carrier-protein] S-malonyltransferase [Tilletia horrida]
MLASTARPTVARHSAALSSWTTASTSSPTASTLANARASSSSSPASSASSSANHQQAQISASPPVSASQPTSSQSPRHAGPTVALTPGTVAHSMPNPNKQAGPGASALHSPSQAAQTFTSRAVASPQIIKPSIKLSISQQSRWLRASPSIRSSNSTTTDEQKPESSSSPAPQSSLFNSISGDGQDDGDQAWAFGGGSSSRGGPIQETASGSRTSDLYRSRSGSSEPVIVGSAGKGAISGYGRRPRPDGLEFRSGTGAGNDYVSHRKDSDRPSPSASWNSGAGSSRTGRTDYQSAQSIWQINFGSGAGKPPQETQSRSARRAEEDEKIARTYVHNYAPSTRSDRPLAQHTYFSGKGPQNSPALAFPPNRDDLVHQAQADHEHQQRQAAQIVPPVTSHPSPLDGAHTGVIGDGAPLSASRHPLLLPKPTALILPGQGSQYVGMSKDLYRNFRAARTIWCDAEEALMASADSYLREFDSKRDVGVDFGWVSGVGGEGRSGSRRDFEEALEMSRKWDPRLGFGATGTAITRRRRGYLRDLVFSGDQLELTKAENASVSIFTCSMAFLATLKREFDIDLIKAHVAFASGHGTSGTYSALCASGVLQLTDAVRFLRHRGLVSGKFLSEDPRLFPNGCDRPGSVFQTWAFANASSHQSSELAEDEFEQQSAHRPHWKRTIMCGVVVRPGQLQRLIREVKLIKESIEKGNVYGIEKDEFVDIANYNGERQIVLGGTKIAVDYTCERLRSKGLGARAVNLPTSGPYHTAMMKGAQELLLSAINALPLRPPALLNLPKEGEPAPQWTPRMATPPPPGTPALRVISSMDPAGPPLDKPSLIRAELRRTMASPVQWQGSVRRLIEQEGVRRFVCVGPGRACAHLLSRELAEYERAHPIPPPPPSHLAAAGSGNSELEQEQEQKQQVGGWGFEVWSIATVEDVELLGELLTNLNPLETRGLSRLSVSRPVHGSDLYTHEEMMEI